MGDYLYRAIRFFGTPFAYRCVGLENIRDRGPAIYVANHLSSVGPVEVILSLPVRLYPWAIAEMTDIERAPLYLYHDFVHPSWRLRGRLGLLVSAIVSRLAVGLINGLGSVAVDRNRGLCLAPFRSSLALLQEGKNLLIFPEDAHQPLDPHTLMRPFLGGFALLCAMHQRLTGQHLPIYPLAVSVPCRAIAVGPPIPLALASTSQASIRQAVRHVQDTILDLKRELELYHCNPPARRH